MGGIAGVKLSGSEVKAKQKIPGFDKCTHPRWRWRGGVYRW